MLPPLAEIDQAAQTVVGAVGEATFVDDHPHVDLAARDGGHDAVEGHDHGCADPREKPDQQGGRCQLAGYGDPRAGEAVGQLATRDKEGAGTQTSVLRATTSGPHSLPESTTGMEQRVRVAQVREGVHGDLDDVRPVRQSRLIQPVNVEKPGLHGRSAVNQTVYRA